MMFRVRYSYDGQEYTSDCRFETMKDALAYATLLIDRYGFRAWVEEL